MMVVLLNVSRLRYPLRDIGYFEKTNSKVQKSRDDIKIKDYGRVVIFLKFEYRV